LSVTWQTVCCRIADWQSHVASPPRRPAGCQPAIRQTTSLRYSPFSIFGALP
jgi:hypothetical protein